MDRTTMSPQDRERVLGIITRLHLAYPEGTYSWRGALAAVVDLWAAHLGDLPLPLVEAAVARWIGTQPKLPHVSDIRTLIAQAVDPLPSEGDVYARRFGYFRHEPGAPAADDDVFAYRVLAEVGSPRDCGQMSPADLREAVTWAYKRLAERERAERTAHVGAALAGNDDRAMPALS